MLIFDVLGLSSAAVRSCRCGFILNTKHSGSAAYQALLARSEVAMSDIGISGTADELAQRLLQCVGAGTVLITEMLPDRHVVHGYCGPRLPERLRHELPIGYPVCEHTVEMGFPLIVDDAFNHPLLRGNPAVSELGIGSYAGAPVFRRNGRAAGTVCAMLPHIHRWNPEQIESILTASRQAEEILFGDGSTQRWS